MSRYTTHSSRALIASIIDTEGDTQRVTRVAASSLNALGSKDTSTYSFGCQITDSPSLYSAGSCFAPFAFVKIVENARADVSIIAEGDIAFSLVPIGNLRI